MFALFINAYHTQIKDEETKRIKKSVIYNIVGIDMEIVICVTVSKTEKTNVKSRFLNRIFKITILDKKENLNCNYDLKYDVLYIVSI